MPDRPNLVYRYDGSFDGLLCCVFESYDKKEIPADILDPEAPQMLYPEREIETDPQKAKRVAVSIPKKLGPDAPYFLRRAFLTCLPQKERHILLFLRLGYRVGPKVMKALTNDTVHTLFSAVKYLDNEAYLFREFIRFSDFNNALVAEIEPKNYVLPLLMRHFCERFPEERFFIYDRSHGMALLYQEHKPEIIPVESLTLPEPDEEERAYRALWRLYYKTIEIEGRHNPRCRMSHMPKRYWACMTEFWQDDGPPRGTAELLQAKRPAKAPGLPGPRKRL